MSRLAKQHVIALTLCAVGTLGSAVLAGADFGAIPSSKATMLVARAGDAQGNGSQGRGSQGNGTQGNGSSLRLVTAEIGRPGR